MKHEKSVSHDIQIEAGDVAYIKLPEYDNSPKVANTIPLHELINNFKGSDIELDFSEDGVLMGIEIITS